jgi:hypothetical protein
MGQDHVERDVRSPASGGRLVRLVVVTAISAAVAGALAVTGAIGYGAAAFGKPGDKGPPSDQYRPGWGCGDKNHQHSGPPGNQYAPPPPGCIR